MRRLEQSTSSSVSSPPSLPPLPPTPSQLTNLTSLLSNCLLPLLPKSSLVPLVPLVFFIPLSRLLSQTGQNTSAPTASHPNSKATDLQNPPPSQHPPNSVYNPTVAHQRRDRHPTPLIHRSHRDVDEAGEEVGLGAKEQKRRVRLVVGARKERKKKG